MNHSLLSASDEKHVKQDLHTLQGNHEHEHAHDNQFKTHHDGGSSNDSNTSTSANTPLNTSILEDAINTSALHMKNIHRTKLTTYDVKIILFLIIEVRPFKYVGDRSVSQTRKWELIQDKYSLLKHADYPGDQKIIVPTVRTLQRQLATAIKKAAIKREEKRAHGEYIGDDALSILSHDEDHYVKSIIKDISINSSVSQMEWAILLLNDLSEKLKNGKVASNSINAATARDLSQIAGETLNHSPNEMIDQDLHNHDLADDVSHLDDQEIHLKLKELIATNEKINHLRNQLDLPKDSPTAETFATLQTLLSQSIEMQILLTKENQRLLKHSELLLQKHEEHINTINNAHSEFEIKQNALDQEIIDTIHRNLNSLPKHQ